MAPFSILKLMPSTAVKWPNRLVSPSHSIIVSPVMESSVRSPPQSQTRPAGESQPESESTPGEWQVYDIIFHAPKKLADGGAQAGSFTLLHNGVLIQNHIPVGGEPTTAAPLQGVTDKVPLYLQDHGNPVRFRNVWIGPL
jgi:hypothetical protein